MNDCKRNKMIIGNWKMYKTRDESIQFIDEILPLVTQSAYTIGIAAPFTSIHTLSEKAKDSKLLIGAQNMHEADKGAFTGEIAGVMLKDAGASFVLLGHSERRKIFLENNDKINMKIHKAVQIGIQPIICIGETYEERTEGLTEEVLRSMLNNCLKNITEDQLYKIVLAYEPIWAIGTGESATVDVIAKTNQMIRDILEEMYTKKVRDTLILLYGGSVSKDNCQELFFHDEIDGLLIGNASVRPESFAKIIALCQNGNL